MIKDEKLKSEYSIHINFKLQGRSFSSAEPLISFSENISWDISEFFKNWFSKKEYIIVKTSGSTGKPKNIKLEKVQMINSALATGSFFNLFENTTALLCMSAEYIAGKMMLVRALTLGWNLDIVKPSSNPLEKIEQSYDFCAMVPLQLRNSLKYISKINTIIVGGGVVSKRLNNKIQDLRTVIYATYGMTETITHIALKKLNCNSELAYKPYFKTLPNINVSIDDRSCLVINAPTISKKNVITNDIVKLISNTEFEWLGRFDTVINSGGIKLIPEQIENKLAVIIKERFFVVGIPDEILGEKMVLFIELQNSTDLKAKDIFFKKINKLKSLLKFEIPKEIHFVNNFVETETKKINRLKTVKLFL